ncbi:MAG: hypothetical protein JSR65_14520 [Proteobacteria bacterium]|nr:hypothetical protein [Pseudomonadota bacterium]
MKSPSIFVFRSARTVALAGSLCITLAAATAHADCPPGTMPDPHFDPSSPAARAHPQRCVPAPKPPTDRYIGPANSQYDHTAHAHAQTPMQQDRSTIKPNPGAPIERTNDSANARGIIFVGGKNAINSQPVPPGHSALNTQPIPPGHSALNTQPIPPGHAPHPNDPFEKTGGH